jgi:hypothetical protein
MYITGTGIDHVYVKKDMHFHSYSNNCFLKPGLWIQIWIRSRSSDIVAPDLYWESGSRGKKIMKFE